MQQINFSQIGQKIKEERISKGFTQEYISNCVGVNVSHISNIENGRVKISLSTLVKVCNAMDITVDYILREEYNSSKTSLENAILSEVKKCDNTTQENILKIIKALH